METLKKIGAFFALFLIVIGAIGAIGISAANKQWVVLVGVVILAFAARKEVVRLWQFLKS